jgi:hypothetical protein
MSQIYCSYLAKFLNRPDVLRILGELLTDDEVYYDWQKMWILAALMTPKTHNDNLVNAALQMYKNGQLTEALRAVAAVFVAKHGSFTRKKELSDNYGISGSAFLQSAVLYGARYFKSETRRTAIKSWSAHSSTHSLVARSISR